MSVNRRLKREKHPSKKEKVPTKVPLKEIVLVAGIATLCFGLFYSFYNHNVYTLGQSEHTTETKGGPIYYPEEAPGDPERKESAATGWKIAGIGIILIALSILLYIIDEVLHGVIGRFKARSSSKRDLRKAI